MKLTTVDYVCKAPLCTSDEDVHVSSRNLCAYAYGVIHHYFEVTVISVNAVSQQGEPPFHARNHNDTASSFAPHNALEQIQNNGVQ